VGGDNSGGERVSGTLSGIDGCQDQRGRLMVLMTHNTDISDTWEREGEEAQAYFNLFSPTGYPIGVNVVLYAMTH